MGNALSVSALEIANYLNGSLRGNDVTLVGVSSLNSPLPETLVFCKSDSAKFPETFNGLAIVPKSFSALDLKNGAIIEVDKPRLAFAKVVNRFFLNRKRAYVGKNVVLGENVMIPESVTISDGCCIGDNVRIGENTVVNHNVIIGANTIIGENCYFKSGSIIGEDGFGFDFEEDGTPVRIPHIGRVIIGNNVEIGAKNTIARGTIEDTIIEDGVKTDDQIHIAHNCKIGKNTIITACAEISGSVSIGKNCWIAPNCTIINKIKIGDNVVVGIGALVIKDIPNNTKVMGLEAIELRSLKKLKKRLEFGAD